MPRTPVTSTDVERITREAREETTDLVAVEEPLQIILEHGEGHARAETPLAITMRTPGHDTDLVTGFLFSESVISETDDLIAVRHCSSSETRRTSSSSVGFLFIEAACSGDRDIFQSSGEKIASDISLVQS